MKRVLILTASYGEGHNAAARGLHAAFAQLGCAEAEVLDLFPDAYGRSYDFSRRQYLRLIERVPRLWASAYWLLDHSPLIHGVVQVLGKVERALREILEERKPDVVITTYPVYNYLLQRIAPHGSERRFRHYTIVTDSITINSVWHRAPSDLYFVPNEGTAAAMRDAGVPAETLKVSGFPVPPVFFNERPARPAPGDGGPIRLLYMVNAHRHRTPQLVERLLEVDSAEVTITIGRHEELRAPLEDLARRSGRKVDILGWTPRVPELLMSHHLLIGKAGGASVQETIAACTPMLMTKVVPGQEEGNAQLLLENHCGELCTSAERLSSAIRRALAQDAALWRQWEQNISRISRPAAALEIARFVANGESAAPAFS